jgi:hypothetical protein
MRRTVPLLQRQERVHRVIRVFAVAAFGMGVQAIVHQGAVHLERAKCGFESRAERIRVLPLLFLVA